MQQLREMCRLGFGQAIASFGNQQDVCRFERPDDRHQRLCPAELIKNTLRIGTRFIFKTPGHDDRVVDHKHLSATLLD